MSGQEASGTPKPGPESEPSFWSEDWVDSDPTEPARQAWRLQAARRLRAALCGVPFYAKRAAQAKAETGDEMDYWLGLQSSEATLVRP